jgi:hypothetical protein
MKLGDAVSSVVTPIMGALGHPCVDPETYGLIPGSPCDKRVTRINQFGDEMYDMFWPTKDDKSKTKSGKKSP